MAQGLGWVVVGRKQAVFGGSSEFVEAAVSLFRTGNSRYEDEKIAPFRDLEESRGGRFESTHFVARGRVLWQLSREELKAAAQEIAQELRGAAGAP